MVSTDDDIGISRRSVLKRSAGAVGLFGTGSVQPGDAAIRRSISSCSEATLRPEMIHYDHHGMDECDDDHPETRALQEAVADSLETRYPTVGALIDHGYIPYFDFVAADAAGGWSHWLNPEFIGDETYLNPDEPASVLVDNTWWRPMGVMFIATSDGDPVDPPPAVYETDEGDGDGDGDGAGGACLPWHAHVGLPGLYSWWKFQLLHTDAFSSGTFELSCATPWMMHVWTLPHPTSVYAHDAPPRGSRGGPPAEPAGFETDAVPGEDTLGLGVLPDIVAHKAERLLNESVDGSA